jgi:molybdate transport system ATP-binding protein
MLKVDIDKQLGAFRLQAAFQTEAPVVALFGRSGSGKTSLVNCLAGIVRPDRGRIEIDGHVLFDSQAGIDLPPERRRIGYVFQDALLFPHLSVERNLLYGARFARGGGAVDRARVIDLLGIGHLLQRSPALLSGGEKQRVAIGRALLADPRILLMDEPLASLDMERRHEILSYIELLRDRLRIPIVFVSHSVPEVTRLADLLVLLSDGRVVAAGDVHDVMNRLELRPHTGRFEAGAVLEAHVLAQDAEFGLTTLGFDGGSLQMPAIDLPAGARVRLRIRARDVSLATERPQQVSLLNVLEGRLDALSAETGPVVEARVQIGSVFLIARITRRSAQLLRLAPGQRVYAMIKAVSMDRRSVGQSG